MRANKLLLAAAGGGGAVLSLIAACSLGLDASKLNALEEAGVGDVTVDVGPEASIPPGATRCSSDDQCGDAAGCYSGKCANGVCQVELCPNAQYVCQHQTCTVDNHCSDPIGHHFKAASMTLGHAGFGCTNLDDCIALVYPFAFMVSLTGVAGYPVVDFGPGDAGVAPEPVTLENVDFTPTRIVASGDRVWFLGPEHPVGVVWQVEIAWIDVPYDAKLRTLTGGRGAVTLPSQASKISSVLPGADKGLIVSLHDTTSALATQLKVVDGGVSTTPQFNSIAGFDGGPPLASTGDRLLLLRSATPPPNAEYKVELIKNAGGGTPVPFGAKDLSAAIAPLALYPDVKFATTPQGGVVAQGAIAQLEDGGIVGVAGVRLAWFLQQADDTQIESKGGAMVLTFPEGGVPSPAQDLVGSVTAIGEENALALQLDNTIDGGGSIVTGVNRDIANKDAAVDPKSLGSMGLPPKAIVLRGAQSAVTKRLYGYAFSLPTSDADGVHLQVFQLTCGN